LYKPASLTSGASSGTTLLSTKYSDALLYGTLVEAAVFLKEAPDVVATFDARFKEALARMKNLSEGRETRDEYRYDLLRTGVT
jgi:predicted nucleotidyltransferase